VRSTSSCEATSSAGILGYKPLQIPLAWPRSTRNGPLSRRRNYRSKFEAGARVR